MAVLNETGYAGQRDWKLVKKQAGRRLSEDAAIDRVRRKEKALDADYYPRLRGTAGIFRVKPVNVENHILVGQAFAGREPKLDKLKPADMAQYFSPWPGNECSPPIAPPIASRPGCSSSRMRAWWR